MEFEQCMYGSLLSKEGVAGKKMICLQKTRSFPTVLISQCHPQRNGIGIHDGKEWSGFQWKKQGGFSLEHHQIESQKWLLLSNVSAISAKSSKEPLLQSHSLAIGSPLDPLLLPSMIKSLSVKPVHKVNPNMPRVPLKKVDERLPSHWLERVTPFLQCILSGSPMSWEDRKIPLENIVETIQLVLLCLPSSMMDALSIKIQSYTLYGEYTLAHGQHARKGVFFMKGSLLGAKKAGVKDCAHYLAKLKSLQPKSKKHLQALITKEFQDIPKSFARLSWKEQGPILAARLTERDTIKHIQSVLPKEPSEKVILSIVGMRSEVLGLLLKHKKQPWLFPLLEKTASWKGAWRDHGIYGMIIGATHPESLKSFRQFVSTKIPLALEEKAKVVVTTWLEKIEPEIWKEMVSFSGASWWEAWKQGHEISLFWCSLDPQKNKDWDHTLYRRLLKKEWSRKAIEKLVAGCPSALEPVYCLLVDTLFQRYPIQGLRLLEEGKKKGFHHHNLWNRLYSPSLYMWKRGIVLQRQIGESKEDITELEVRIVLTFLEEGFARVDEIAPHLGALAMQYFFGPKKLKSKNWMSLAENVIKERMIWNPDAYFVHIGIPGIHELYLESINESTVLPAGGTGALLWMLLKGQQIDDSISLPEGFIELCTKLSYPIALSQVDSAAVLYALVIHRNIQQRAACTKEQIQRMLFWYVQSKRVDAPLQWTSEPIWRLFPFMHDFQNSEKALKDEEISFLQEVHPSLLRKLGSLGLLLKKEHLELISFRPNHRFVNIRTFSFIIIEAKAKQAAIHLGGSLWMRLSEENREKLQTRIRLKTIWWRRILRFVLRSRTEVMELKRRSEVLEALCMEFNCLGEIVLAAQNESGNAEADT